MDFKSLFKNKKFLIVAGVVVIIGFFLYRKDSTSTVNLVEDYGESTGDVSSSDVSELSSSLESIVDYFSDRYESQQEQIETLQNELISTQNDSSSIVPDTTLVTALETLTTAVNSLKSGNSSTTSTTTKSSTGTSKKYFTVEKYTGKNPYTGTLGGIAIKFNTTVKKLMALNPSIKNANLIYAGQKIRVA